MSSKLVMRPRKRLRNMQQKRCAQDSDSDHIDDQTTNKLNSIENLIDIKKRRFEAVEREKNLTQMLEELTKDRQEKARNGEFGVHVNVKEASLLDPEQNMIYATDFHDDFILDSAHCVDNDELEEAKMKEAARLYLDEEAQENIEQAIEETKQVEVVESKDCWNQAFFRPGNKNIRQPGLISKELGIGQKEIHISELSATSNGRAFLLETGCMKDWHNSGWKCPNYIYQWLFEVVALEPNKLAAKNALATLFVLWSLPGNKVDTRLPHIYKQRYIKLNTFKSVLLTYDAIPSQLVEGVLSTSEDQDMVACVQNIEHYDDIQSRYLPLTQLGYMIKAFSFSVRLWSKAYTAYEIRHTVRLLLQMSIDKTGYLVLQEIQAAVDNCLSAMNDATWETEIKTIANDVCDMVTSTKRQVHLFDSLKTIYERSRYLRRVIGVTCLERCLEKEVPGSVDYISTDQTTIQQISQIFGNPGGFFKQRQNMDYEECYIRVAMLDAAIGTDDDEIRYDKEIVLVIAAELRDIGLGIGARLGVMKKTLANEMIQRVWSRISYIVGKKVVL